MYIPIHAWKRKDKLPSKDPQKIIYGEQLQDEFDAISKGMGDLEGQIESIEIGEGGGSDGGPSSWDEITNKPTEFPPESHTHGQSQIDGLEDRLTSIEGSIGNGGGASSWDEITGKPTEFPPEAHGHEEIAKDAAYIRYEVDTWRASPSMEVEGSLSVGGDLAITGRIEGDLTVNGNITIDGGQIVDPDGNPAADTNIPILDAPPEAPELGEQWFSSTDGYLYIWYGAEWVAIGGTA